jgi:ABC-type multidrug transport system fused ATPase/permease subunit
VVAGSLGFIGKPLSTLHDSLDDTRAPRAIWTFPTATSTATIRDADLILVMENGQIAEKGTHAKLLAAGGAYPRLYQAQFAQALTAVD